MKCQNTIKTAGICLLSYLRQITSQSLVLGYREYHYDEAGNEIGYSNYKRINDEIKLIYSTKSSWIEKDVKAICKFYDDKNKFLYYEIFEHDENCRMVWMGTYNTSGEEAHIPFQSYSDF